MEYIKTTQLDFNNTFFHFTRIDNRDSIEQNGLQSVAGGENKAGGDSQNPTTYFSYKADGLLKAIDVWIKWEYNKLRWNKNFKYSPTEQISEDIMKETYEKIYSDFKNRNYYKLDLIEGDNPETSDFSFDGIDKKKEDEYNKFLHKMAEFKRGNIPWEPQYPNKDMKWMYGSYSDFNNGCIKQDNWNMNTHIGNKIISTDIIKIIEGENGRTDALSVAIDIYNKCREQLIDIDLSVLDDFIEYAKERYRDDKDFSENMPDIGRRAVNPFEEQKYKQINGISTQTLGQQVIEELSDTILLDETERIIANQERQIEHKQENQTL